MMDGMNESFDLDQMNVQRECEGGACTEENPPTYYCAQCDCDFCDSCWIKQPSHKPSKRGTDGQAHEKIDRLVVERYRAILEPSSNAQEQQMLHKDDEDSTWFGIGRNQANDPVFEDYGQYATLMAESLSKAHKIRHPQLVSFIGQTGAGKSTVVKMLINNQDMKMNPTARARFPSPVVGSVNDNVPVSANVHLYADPNTISGFSPVLYADCEGLEGGESDPRAEKFKMQEMTLEVNAQLKGSRAPYVRKKLQKKGHGPPRVLSWAKGDEEKSKREYAVTELYPRLLYTFSDVVVFVLRNPKVFESAVLTKLIRWASASFEKSLGQPALPHVIVVLNATDLAIDPSQWDVKEATQKLLSDVAESVDIMPALQAHVEMWRANGRSIKTTKDLLQCYYSSITVVRIPAKGRYNLIDEQVEKLHTEIVIKCNQSHYMKKRVRMLSNSDDLQLYLQLAFDHFSRNLDTPFNFIEIALKINPIPSDFGGNILKLAIAVKNGHPGAGFSTIFDVLRPMVASCIMLDIHRHRRLGTAKQLLEDHYMIYCEQAFDEFCNRHWPCAFQRKQDRCVSTCLGHDIKGHQNKQASVIGAGPFIASFRYDDSFLKWTKGLELEIEKIQGAREKALPVGADLDADEITWSLHLQNLTNFYARVRPTSGFASHSTCLCCLANFPVHPLVCGHVLCTACVRSYSGRRENCNVQMRECPIGQVDEEKWPQPCNFEFKPPLAGTRILSLDGGGMRGIVELEVLKAIERELPSKIPIRRFFDLIVGTSTGGIIALGLGVEGWSVDDCIAHFNDLCATAFTPRELHGIPGLRRVAMMSHGYSMYKTQPFERVLRTTLTASEQPLFGAKHPQSTTNVAVISATETASSAVLMANYNRPYETFGSPSSYRFERAETPVQELRVWETARATSAAPSYFKPFKSPSNKRVYLDGALFHNNPVRAADLERRLIWPDTENLPPDILLSIGTGSNNTISNDARNHAHSAQQMPAQLDPSPTPVANQEKPSGSKAKKTNMRTLFTMCKNRIESLLDTEIIWLNFQSDNSRGEEDDRLRYRRISPDIGTDPPKLDEVKEMPKLQNLIRNMRSNHDFQKQIKEVSRQLVASCFYVDESPLQASKQEYETVINAAIKCRFPSGSQELRSFGEFLINFTTHKFQPHFVLREKGISLEPLKVFITREVIQEMTSQALFHIMTVNLPISNEAACISIGLSIIPGEELPISGFPRTLIDRKVSKAIDKVTEESEKQGKMKRVLSHFGLGDDSGLHSHDSSEHPLDILQGLPSSSKALILESIRKEIRNLQVAKQDIPINLKRLAKASQPSDDDSEKSATSAQGMASSNEILHAAAFVGDLAIIRMQIKAGVDVMCPDSHGWTAEKIARIQGHRHCEQILSGHSLATDASYRTEPSAPTALVTTESSRFVKIGSDRLSVSGDSWHENLSRRIQVRSNHPIPPDIQWFYYEITIHKIGPLGIIGLGLCKPHADRFGMPGWKASSLGYHGDDGRKFISNGWGRKYSIKYGVTDTVGCGISMKTRTVFFTVNGLHQGIAFSDVFGVLYPVLGFGENGFEVSINFGSKDFAYDLSTHDWDSIQ